MVYCAVIFRRPASVIGGTLLSAAAAAVAGQSVYGRCTGDGHTAEVVPRGEKKGDERAPRTRVFKHARPCRCPRVAPGLQARVRPLYPLPAYRRWA